MVHHPEPSRAVEHRLPQHEVVYVPTPTAALVTIIQKQHGSEMDQLLLVRELGRVERLVQPPQPAPHASRLWSIEKRSPPHEPCEAAHVIAWIVTGRLPGAPCLRRESALPVDPSLEKRGPHMPTCDTWVRDQ